MNETIKRFSGLTPVVIVLCYFLYGWGLTIITAPLLYWAIALGIGAFLSLAVSYSFIVSLPTILLASIFVVTPLALNVVIIRGNDFLVEFANRFSNILLFGILATVIAMLWFSPLFWAHRVLIKTDLSTRKVIGILIGCSWLGLGLGRLWGIWH